MSEIRWFYIAEGRRQGPVDLTRLVELIHAGTLPEEAPVWAAGRLDWIPANRIPEIAREIPPPLPGTATALSGGPAGMAAAETGAPEGTSAALGVGDGKHSRHRHRHKHRRFVLITSPWWRRWLFPFLIALVGLAVVVWLYLNHVDRQPPPGVYVPPVGAVSSPYPFTA